jgi:hypothetical protein
MYVYPAMRKHVPNGEQAVEHDTREHKQLKEIMKQLEAVSASEPRFDALVRDLTEKLRHHAHDEETEQFPLITCHNDCKGKCTRLRWPCLGRSTPAGGVEPVVDHPVDRDFRNPVDLIMGDRNDGKPLADGGKFPAAHHQADHGRL